MQLEKCSQVSQRFKQITVSRAACVHVCACVRASVRVATEMIGIQVLLTIGFLTFSNSCLSGEWAAKEVLRA